MTDRYAIGIDLGGTNLKIALVDERGKIVAKNARPSDAHNGAEFVADSMRDLTHALLAESRLSREKCLGAGLGTPGPLDLTRGVITHAANLPGWRNVPIRDMLSERLQLPVVVENDGNAAALGEWWAGAGRGGGDMVLLTLGTGVGAGVILGGKILHGHFDNAGEMGHLIMVIDGLPCPCGQRGCLEQYASASGLARRAQAALDEEARGNVGDMSRATLACSDVVNAVRAGNVQCGRLFDDACRYLAAACVNIQHAYNPAKILLGGGLAEAGALLVGRVKDQFQKLRWSLHSDFPEIDLATLGNDAGLIGAAALILDQGVKR